MAKPKNALEVFKLLDKSNCRLCGEKTCLAFAGAVYTGNRSISDCPRLSTEAGDLFTGNTEQAGMRSEAERHVRELQHRVASMDLAEAAERIGGRFDGRRLTVKILGKDFGIDTNGTFISDIHVNPWISGPFLTYVLECRGVPVSGNWQSFREIKDGKEMYPLFRKRCEEALKRLADTYADLFSDMVQLFAARQVEQQFASDISVVLYPLPLVPMMICYWRAEGEMTSELTVFYDRSVDENLGMDGAFYLGTGITQMFEKLVRHHGAQAGRR